MKAQCAMHDRNWYVTELVSPTSVNVKPSLSVTGSILSDIDSRELTVL